MIKVTDGRSAGASHELNNEVALLGFCFGLCGHAELPGTALVEMLALLGRSPTAARSLIARSRRHGVLASRRMGRSTAYRLAGAAADVMRELQFRGTGAPSPEPWEGAFHGVIYTAPESRRTGRDLTRRVGLGLGYRLLHPGVLVHLVDRHEELQRRVGQVDGLSLLVVSLGMGLPDARRTVAELWELDLVAGQLREAATALDALGKPPPVLGVDHLQAYVAAVRVAYQMLLVAPTLPEELVPDAWPAPELDRALGRVHAVWSLAAHRRVAQLVGVPPVE